MTSKKWTVIISATLTAIGIIVFAILQFELYRYVIIFVDNTAGFYLKLSHALHTWDSNNGELLSQCLKGQTLIQNKPSISEGYFSKSLEKALFCGLSWISSFSMFFADFLNFHGIMNL